MRRFIPLLLAALPAFATTITSADITGFGTTVVSGSAAVSYLTYDPSVDPSSIFKSASATAISGASGPGFLVINVTGGGGGGDFGGGSASIGPYSWNCTSSGCATSGFAFGAQLPFTLGAPFQVNISAFANGRGAGSGTANFQFSVFQSVDLGGGYKFLSSVPVYDPPEVPEPATILLSSGGLALLVFGQRILRRSL